MAKSKRRQITVGKTKIVKAPWEEERHIYNVNVGNNSIWSDEFFGVVVQLIVGISVFIYFLNI
jgi:hypothetical protein